MENLIMNIIAFIYCILFASWHIIIWVSIVAYRLNSLPKAIEEARKEFDLKWVWFSLAFYITGAVLFFVL